MAAQGAVDPGPGEPRDERPSRRTAPAPSRRCRSRRTRRGRRRRCAARPRRPAVERGVVVPATRTARSSPCRRRVGEVGRRAVDPRVSFPAVSAVTDATSWRSSSRSRNARSSKLGCRTSTAWRRGRSALDRRSDARPDIRSSWPRASAGGRRAWCAGAARGTSSSSSAVERRGCGGSCQSIGPSFAPSASTPRGEEVRERRRRRRASCLMWVMKRAALHREARTSSGVASRQRTPVRRLLQRVERAVDLDRGHARRRVSRARRPGAAPSGRTRRATAVYTHPEHADARHGPLARHAVSLAFGTSGRQSGADDPSPDAARRRPVRFEPDTPGGVTMDDGPHILTSR